MKVERLVRRAGQMVTAHQAVPSTYMLPLSARGEHPCSPSQPPTVAASALRLFASIFSVASSDGQKGWFNGRASRVSGDSNSSLDKDPQVRVRVTPLRGTHRRGGHAAGSRNEPLMSPIWALRPSGCSLRDD